MRVSTVVASVVAEPERGLRLVARRGINRRSVIVTCQQNEVTEDQTYRTVQIGHNLHVKNRYLDYVDHSCDPNTVFDVKALVLVAINDIHPGESLTMFYPGSEVELVQDFECRCQNQRCLGHVKGWSGLTHEQRRRALWNGYCTGFIIAQFPR